MFDRMPDVPQAKYKKQQQSKPNRAWLLGVTGCLLLLACIGVAGFALWLGGPTLLSTLSPGTKPASAPIAQPTLVANTVVRGKVAYSIDKGAQPEDKFVWVMNADGSGARQILERASSPEFSPDGSRIVFYRWNDGIYVANADGSNQQKIVGESNAKFFAWSHDGKWIAFSSQPVQKEGANINIDAVQVDGTMRRTLVLGGSMPSWSPDDKEIVFHTCQSGNCGIYKASAQAGPGSAFTLVAGEMGGNPSWSPDGKKIVYHADTDTVKQIFSINSDGTGKKQLTSGTVLHVDPHWSPDNTLIYYRSPEGGDWGIWRMNADGSNPARLGNGGPPVDWAYERIAVSGK